MVGRPPLRELRRGIVNFNETEHLQQGKVALLLHVVEGLGPHQPHGDVTVPSGSLLRVKEQSN